MFKSLEKLKVNMYAQYEYGHPKEEQETAIVGKTWIYLIRRIIFPSFQLFLAIVATAFYW